MKNLRNSLLLIFALLAFGQTAWAQWTGSGTEADPYLISSADDWNTLSDNVSNGTHYTGKYFKLTADMHVTKRVSTLDNSFEGTFDGDGHTLDVNYATSSNNYFAPFRYVKNATIKNLHITGKINTLVSRAAGIVGLAEGTVNIINCRSSIYIDAIWPYDHIEGYHGGFISMCKDATINIINGLFDGKFETYSFDEIGGFVGLVDFDSHVNLVNCLCDPELVDLSDDHGCDTYVAYNDGDVTMSHCFYIKKIGKAQGTEAKGWNNTQYLFALGSGWHEVDGKVVPDKSSQTHDYSLTGEGTAASPYLIGSVTDWHKLVVCPSVDGTSGKYFKMTQDITLTETVSSGFRTTMVGTSKDASFKGTFDGDGHTLTVNYTDNSSDHYTAPFRFINEATINNLHVTGTISKEKKKHAGGLVGQAFGENRITNCRSSVTIEANTDGDGSHGGFIGDLRDGYTVLSYCLFDGKMRGPSNTDSRTTKWGGFIGWVADDGEANFKHCLFAPTAIKISDKGSCYTFARRDDSDDLTFTNCYYTQLLGGSQAKQARSISGNANVTVAPYGTVSQHNVSGITTYSLGSAGIAFNPCILYNDILYSGNGSGVVLSPSQVGETPAGAQANSFIATPGSLSRIMTDYHYLSMTDANQIISLAPSDWTSHAGTEADPYLIYTTEQWNLLADRVNNQDQTYSGKFFKLMADITVAETVSSGTPITMVGTSDSKSFQGTFDGNGHTITLNYSDTRDTDFCAPFCYINGATIKFLHVSGSIYKTKGKNAGGFVGKAVGDNTIDNCRSSVDIQFNKDGDVSSGGFIGELRESGSTTFNNCLFDGKLRGTNAKSWGGFVGWVASGRTVTFNNCLFNPEQINFNTNDSKTFARKDGTVIVNNCYYKTLINDAQGATDAASYSNATLLDALGLGWETIMENEVEKVVPIMAVYPLSGDGTEDVPFLITSAEDWNHLASNQFLNVNYNGKYFQLTNNISVTRMVGYDGDHAFQGTFDGDGNTITVSYGTAASPIDIQFAAAFKNTYGATIKNLRTTGTIYTANTHSGGVVGRNGTGNLTMTNVTSDVTINSTYNGNAHHGGLVGYTLNATLTGCSFTGKLLGSSSAKCGGLMGWKTSTASTRADFYDCLFAPTQVTVSATDSKTFVVDNGTVNFTNCYYTAPLGTVQGKLAHSITAGNYVSVENAGTATEYDISGITSYGVGIKYNDVLYAGNEEAVALTLNCIPLSGYAISQYVANEGTLTGNENPYSLTMPDANVVINANITMIPGCDAPTDLTVTHLLPNSATLSWTGNQETYQLRYRQLVNESAVFFESFEDGVIPSTWTTIDHDGDGHNWLIGAKPAYNVSHGNYAAVSESYNKDEGTPLNPDNWLITPPIDLQGVMRVGVVNQDPDNPEHFAIYLSTTGNTVDDFLNNGVVLVGETEASGDYTKYTASLSAYEGQQGYIAIRHFNSYDSFMLNVDAFGIYVPGEGGEWVEVNDIGNNTIDIDDLTSETLYEWQVCGISADCGGNTLWSQGHFFTTSSECALPVNLACNALSTSATLGWDGVQNTYNLRYRTIPHTYFKEDFEEGIPDTWTIIDADGDGESWHDYIVEDQGYLHSGIGAAISYSYHYLTEFDPDNWLITPQLELTGMMEVWVRSYHSGYPDYFAIYLSTTGNAASDFTTVLVEKDAASGDFTKYTADLSDYEGQRGYIAIRHFDSYDNYALMVDDFSIHENAEPSEWITVNNIGDNTLALNGLTPETDYEWQVQGINEQCGEGTTEWSECAFFTTTAASTFIKEITGYGDSDGGWYLIASPLAEAFTPTAENGFLTNAYDLYRFNQAAELEWENWKAEETDNYHFDLESGHGYLYASHENTTLVFTGEPYSGNGEVTLSKTDNASFPGWNLVGNPFNVTAYIADGRNFYVMNAEGSEIEVATSNSIAPMEGIFVIATENGETMTFTTEAPSNNGKGLALNLSHGIGVIDRAIVRFGEGNQQRNLPKFQMRSNSTKVYIPQDNRDYAVVSAENEGEMPVSFKAKENGTYTLSVSGTENGERNGEALNEAKRVKTENGKFSVLRLIDNLTGADIDLLQSPSYTFEAKTTDYESRFKLVFATGNASDDPFASFSNGTLVINHQGNATMNVYDVTGRRIDTQRVNGTCQVGFNPAPGVYMIQLVGGNDTKTQKIVVK